jgi:hypothetical protein
LKVAVATSGAFSRFGAYSEMDEDHQITVFVAPDLLRSGRYRWTLLHSGQAQDRSEMSFATKEEADADAEKALKRRIAAWKAT